MTKRYLRRIGLGNYLLYTLKKSLITNLQKDKKYTPQEAQIVGRHKSFHTTMKYYTTGTPLMESDRDILTQFLSFTGSVRTGFNSIFDRLDTAPNDIDATRVNIVAGINIAR